MRRALLQTHDEFRSLASLLRAQHDDPEDAAPFDEPEFTCEKITEEDASEHDELELVRDVRLFHAHVMEAVDAAVDTLLARIANDVLARELALGPADVDAIVDRALARCASEEPLRIRVHPRDAARVRCGVPVAPDERLVPGDAFVELRHGSIDASLAVRITAVLGAVT
jgi:hypothetical protein